MEQQWDLLGGIDFRSIGPVSLSHWHFDRGKEEPIHHNNQFNYHRYQHASRPLVTDTTNKRLKPSRFGPSTAQHDLSCPVRGRLAVSAFDGELPCHLVAIKYAQPSSNLPSKIDTRLAVSYDASTVYVLHVADQRPPLLWQALPPA